MAIETFTWCPRINAEGTVTHRNRQAQMGDGYKQTAGDGINPRSQEWDLTFVGDEDYISQIKAFIDRHGGVKSFQWKPPLEPLGLYKCNTYKPLAIGGNKHSLSAKFTESFSP